MVASRAFFVIATFCAMLAYAGPACAQPTEEFDSSTPRRAAASFMDAAHRGDWDLARTALEGGTGVSSTKRERTIDLAKKLAYLLPRSITFEIDDISDAPEGKPEDGDDVEEIASLRMNGNPTPIVLRRTKTVPQRWVFSAGTLARVPQLYDARGPSKLEAYMPPALREQTLGMARWQWLGLAVGILVAVMIGRAIAYVTTRVGTRIAEGTRVLWDDELVKALRSPSRLFWSVFVFVPVVPALALPGTVRLVCWRVATTLGLIALAWSAIRIVGVVSNLVERRALEAASGGVAGAELRTRGVQTQVRVLRRVLTIVLVVCAGAVMLMQFEVVRNVGVSLLASAGVAGVVLGLAAQRTLGSLFAGIQLSITQPIRMGDDVVIEGEFGTIEEITLTYVVVKIWDERRLIVPMSRFLEQPFQNWTKVSSQLHGTIMLYTDWYVPVEAVRAELARLLEGHPLWDGRTKAVHVTDAKERTLEIRVLVSAKNGGNLFNLRAELREKLVAWLSQLDTGRYLPRARVEGPALAAEP
jgi:small-conductance mechanosensitive channel